MSLQGTRTIIEHVLGKPKWTRRQEAWVGGGKSCERNDKQTATEYTLNMINAAAGQWEEALCLLYEGRSNEFCPRVFSAHLRFYLLVF